MKLRWYSMAAMAALLTWTPVTQADDIVDTAVGAGKFKTLAAALSAADLVETLKGDGPFTVFAPTDDAFAKLPAGTVQTLLKPENKGKLAGILTYHVVAGKVLASQVVGLNGATTVNGQRVDIKAGDAGVTVDGANVVATDIVCDNGVIHVIDSVILPADENIPAVATAAGSFGTLLAAAQAAGLVDALSGDGPLTVFAPTDAAFAALPDGTVDSLLMPENKEKLVAILKYHVVAGRVYSDSALNAKKLKTLGGQNVRVGIKKDEARVNKAKLIATDIDASNGVIHVIDSVLLPPQDTADAREVLQKTVAMGSRLFNAGHHSACADCYSEALQGMMSTRLDKEMKSHIQSVMTAAGRLTCPTERSWTLRRGIDQLYMQMTLAELRQ